MLEVIEPEEPSKPLISAVTGQPFGPRVRYISEKQEEESTDDEPLIVRCDGRTRFYSSNIVQ